MKEKNLQTCPSCGFKVFSEPSGSYEICTICNWEDDPVQALDPDIKGGANSLSLREFQDKILKEIPQETKTYQGFEKDQNWKPLRKDKISQPQDKSLQSSRIKILGIPFDHVTKSQALQRVIDHLKSHAKSSEKTGTFFIATPNPEMLLEADRNKPFKKVLQTSHLNIADGIGILWASKVLKTPLPERVTGVDFMLEICAKVGKERKIFLLGAKEGVAEKVQRILQSKIPGIHIVGTFSGSPAPGFEQEICTRVRASQAEILFVAFGAPKQELWLAKNLSNLPTIKVAMGIGGAFDFISGVRKRAPLGMQKMGLEWLFRLIQEPRRIKRIYNATVKFPFKFLFSKKH